MDSLLFLGLVAGAMLLFAVRQNTKVRAKLSRHAKKLGFLPKAISVLILVAQLTELLKMMDHLSIVSATGSLFLLAIMGATKSSAEEIAANDPGTEGEWF